MPKMFLSGCIFFTFFQLQAGGIYPPGPTRCELFAFPEQTAITDLHPEFSWQIHNPRQGAHQIAYQIIVSSTPLLANKQAGDFWDSGRVDSDASVNVEYAGKPLSLGAEYFWRVRIWDQDHRATDFSTVQKIRLATETQNVWPKENSNWSNRYGLLKTRVVPVVVRQKHQGHYFIDFGRAAFGTVEVTLANPRVGNIQVHLGEVLAATDSIHRNPGGSRRYRTWSQPIAVGRHPLLLTIPADRRNTHGDAVGMPPAIGEVMPFRYCELEHISGKLSAKQIRQIIVHYPFDEDAASFNSSSKTLNDVWELCKYSIKATSFLGVYVDGDRERIPYEGDAYINQLSHYAVDAEYSLARHSIDYLFEHPTWPAEWQMHMVLMAWADYMYTGNSELLARRYDELAAKTLVGLCREDGLIVEDSTKMTPLFLQLLNLNLRPRILVDWPPADFTRNNRFGERDGYDMRPVNAVANAFHYRTLRLMAQISRVIGKAEQVAIWQERAEQVFRSFQKTFFNGARGVYVDGEGSQHSALHANFFPLAFGLAPVDHLVGIIEFIKSRGMACSVYASQYLLDALFEVGEAEYALSLLTATHDRSWAHMIYTVKSTITTEAWDNKYKENQDWNHAWGAAPANIIPRDLMGLQPLEPGFKKIRIRPQIGSLTFARIKMPTIRGAVLLDIDRTAQHWQAKVTLPANMSAEIHLPTTDIRRVRESGRLISENPYVRYDRTESGKVVLLLQSGKYSFRID